MHGIVILWYIVYLVQFFLNYGTAYRLTKYGGDNGLSLWGWFFVLSLASIIPGLGVYLWFKYTEENMSTGYDNDDRVTSLSNELREAKNQINMLKADVKTCSACDTKITKDSIFCKSCGVNLQEREEELANARRKRIEEGGGDPLDMIFEDEGYMKLAKGLRRIYGKDAYIEELKRKVEQLGFDKNDIPDDVWNNIE